MVNLKSFKIPLYRERVMKYTRHATDIKAAASWVKKEIEIFRQTAANFRKRRLLLLLISIFLLNSPKMGDIQPEIFAFGRTFSDKKNIFR